MGDEIAGKLAGLARALEHLDRPDTVLAAIVAAAVALVPGADEGSISAISGRARVWSHAPTSDLPRLVDAVQEEVRQGPCLDAAYEHQTVRIADMTSEQRWPLFAARAAELGAGSMLALQLYVEGDDLGAINLFARTPGAFTDESEQIGLLVAAHAAIAYVGARKGADLAAALANRDLIGQAKGMLMERYHLSGDRAFLLLTRVSQNSNRKLHQVATELVETGAVHGPHGLPAPPR
ncbi:GAF and ANTAR domain-containing protein [Microlunatus aurantiacus]|uniref:GAF and ANTAR domain-containing protein n=1 Tax=Microlunatus aurantiacus TaxID=446786 RepID=A0ABP7DP73_9ACTN